MIVKFLKRVLYGFLILLLSFAVLMSIPRIWSSLNPQKAPLGYYFFAPTVIAVYTGLETLINKTPPIPENVVASN